MRERIALSPREFARCRSDLSLILLLRLKRMRLTNYPLEVLHHSNHSTGIPLRHIGGVKPLALGKNRPQNTRMFIGNSDKCLRVSRPLG